MFNAGILLTNPRVSRDPLRGVAWTIVALERGYDGPAAQSLSCAEPRSCTGTSEYADSLQRDLGAERYARTYALAQEIEELLAREDWVALERYWRPDPLPR
jgi:hypothetical protein